jgi:predicted GNAT family acetyltransferase
MDKTITSDIASGSVRDNKALSRFELDTDGHTAFADYRVTNGTMTFTHTEVPPELGGRGIASRLIQGALEAVRAQGLKVVSQCSFVTAYIERHPDFRGLLA